MLKSFYEIGKKKVIPISQQGFVNKPDLSDRFNSVMYLGFSSISLKRKSKNEWDLYVAYKTKEGQYEFKTLKQGTFNIKNNSIYYNNTPIIIYNYY